MHTRPIRVLCVDDHAALAEGLQARLESEPDLVYAGHLPTADHLVPSVRDLDADIVLLDIDMPGVDPFEALADLHKRMEKVRTIVLSAYVRDHYFEAAVEGGAWGYLSKRDPPENIVEGIRRVVRGDFALSPEVQERTWFPDAAPRRRKKNPPVSRLSLLTQREQQVLRMIGRGLSRADIAHTLHRSPKTIDSHQTAIMEKLDIHGRVELVRFAIREGLVEP